MKTILINFLGRNNSAPYFSYSIGKALKDKGYDVIAIVSKHATNIDAWRNYGFRKVYEVDTYTSYKDLLLKSMIFLIWESKAIKKQLKREKIGYVINTFFHPWSNIVSSICGNAQNITFCHDPVLHVGVNPIMRLMYPFFIKKGNYVVVLTRKYIDTVEKLYGIDRKKIYYCPHGRMDLYKKVISSEKPSFFPKYKKGDINYIFFGRIEKYKGIDLLGKAYKLVKMKYSNVSLTIFGAGNFEPYKGVFKGSDINVINEYISDENIGWIFNEENIVLVLPYKKVTQSGVIPIAFEYGVPVICSDLIGFREQLDNGQVGLYFNPDDEKSLACEMEKFINDKSLYDIQKKKMRIISENIEWNDIIGNLMKEIDDA